MKKSETIKILLVEDDANLGIILQESLQAQSYSVERAFDGLLALEMFKKNTFDLCLIDVMLPKKDGFSLARSIKSINKETPIMWEGVL